MSWVLKNYTPFLYKITAITALSLTVSACGGGGASPTSPTSATVPAPTPPPPPPIIYNTAEYQENPALAQMNVQAAYLNGISGQGVLVAVIDSGVTEISELQGKIHADSVNIATFDANDVDDFIGHGTGNAAIIAARQDHSTNNNPNNMHGVAFNARILSINATTPADCTDFENCSFSTAHIAAGYDYARTHGVRIINESLGSDNAPPQNLKDALKRAVDAGILIVVPDGNIPDGAPAGTGDSAQLSASFAYAPEANGQIIIAGSVDSNNQISDFSYKAGANAMNVFLVAPGKSITVPNFDVTFDPNLTSTYYSISGTSASTAMISGVAALLKQAFPNLTAKQLANLLFTTATDLGVPGVDIIYGHGLVNVAKAFTAQGQFTIAGTGFGAGSTIGSSETVSAQNFVISGGAFGADISFAKSFENVSTLDSYDRSYVLDMSQSVFVGETAVNLGNYIDGSIEHRHQSLSLNDQANLTLNWRSNDRFAEINQNHFAFQHGLTKQIGQLRMSLAYDLDPNKTAIASSGMSLSEMLDDVRPDDFLSPNLHGFTSLINANGNNAIAYRSSLHNKGTFEFAVSRSDMQFGGHIFPMNVKVKNTLALGRYSFAPNQDSMLGFEIGFMKEKGSVLGSISRGALEIGHGAKTSFAALKLDYDLASSIQFYARASYGLTDVDISQSSLIGNVSKLQSYSYLMGLKKRSVFFDDDHISCTYSQPLRLSNGTAQYSQVLSRNFDTNTFIMNTNTITLNPSGRERDIEMSYSIANIWGGTMRLNLLHQINPGHSKNIPNATSLLIRIGSSY